MSTTDPIKQAWQASGAAAPLPPLETLRKGSDAFYRHVRRRNAIEYGASAIVIVGFTAYVFLLPSIVARVGAALVVLGTLFVVWQLHRRASATPPPEAQAAVPLLVHQREQLARQRDALASVGAWYLLPFAPGMLLMMFAPAIERGPATLLAIPPGAAIVIATVILAFIGIWWINRHVARKLQAKVEALDRLLRDQD